MNRSIPLIFVLVLTVSSLMMVKLAFAQIPTPSVPQFKLEYFDASYSETNTDPFTGANVTHLVDNRRIYVTVQNQPFAYSSNGTLYDLYYNVRFKGHFAQDVNWRELYSLAYSNYPTQENSKYLDYTTFSYSLEQIGITSSLLLSSNAQVEFQVEAMAGHLEYTPLRSQILIDETSGWSPTQTIAIPTTSTTPTPALSPSPSIPEFPSWIILPIAIALLFILYLLKGQFIWKKEGKKKA